MEAITIQGKQIPYTRERIPVEKCDLDPKNPRVQFLVGQGYNHFEIFETLANPYGLLGRAALEQMKLVPA